MWRHPAYGKWWMIGHACVREEAGSNRRVVESDLSRPETTAGGKAVCRC